MSESQLMTKQRLATYVSLRLENENRMERLARLKNEAEIPAIRPSDGSQHMPGGNGRLERAIVRAMAYKERIKPLIEANRREMETIESAIAALPDPMEREVLRLRYIDGKNCKLMPWRDIAIVLYGENDEAQIRAVFRLHGKALQHIRGG